MATDVVSSGNPIASTRAQRVTNVSSALSDMSALPPPPAPPNVPQISRLQEEILTTRERLRMHQEEAQCASCHRKIDPIGLGLENFNAAGKWRTTDSFQARDKRGRGVGKKKTWDIEPSGAIYNGPSFADYFELIHCRFQMWVF